LICPLVLLLGKTNRPLSAEARSVAECQLNDATVTLLELKKNFLTEADSYRPG
jgi:hypothetical protein